MIKKLFLNQAEKVKTESWLLNQDKASRFFFYLLLLFLPTQFGKHFWPDFSFVYGLRLDYLSPTFYLTDLIIFLIFLFSFQKIIKFLITIKKRKIIIYSFFFISLLIGITISKNPLAGTYGVIKIIEFSFLALFTYLNINLLNKKIIFALISITLVFESFLSFAQYLNQSSLNGIFYFLGERSFTSQTPGIANASINGQLVLRPYATFPHPNVLAGFLITSMLYLFSFFSKFKNAKLILFSEIIIGTAALVLTLSRITILIWAIYLIVLFGILIVEKYKKQSSNRKIFLSITTVILFLIILLSFFQNSIFIQRFSETKFSDESFSQRQELISQSINMIVKNPVLGVGVNNFYNNLIFSNTQNTFLIQPVHNIYLYVLSQTGIIGFVFFIYLFYKMISTQLFKKSKNKTYLLMIILGVIIIGMFDHYFLTIQQGQLMLAIIIGTTLSYENT